MQKSAIFIAFIKKLRNLHNFYREKTYIIFYNKKYN